MRSKLTSKLALAVAGLGLLASAAPVWAHHAFAAEFDSTKPIKLHGTVTKMEWINPHAWIHIDVKNHFAAKWFYQGVAAARHGDRGGRLSIQGRKQQDERPRHHVSRWAQALCRIGGAGFAGEVREIIPGRAFPEWF